MRLLILKLLLRFLAMLPLPLNHALGGFFGWITWCLPTAARRITETNLKLCFPEKSKNERLALTRSSLVETGKALTELGWIWCKERSQMESKIIQVCGQEHLEKARTHRGGVIFISPHIGAWELCMLPLSNENQAIVMYRQPRQLMLEPLLIAARTRHGGELARLSAGGIKTVLRGLKEGRAMGILPDQEPDLEGGVFAPFFGVPANTMTLLSRMARSADAGMVFIMLERLDKGRGFRLRYLPADENIRDRDNLIATTALNRSVEACIAVNPAQYIWSYKRFRLQEDGSRRAY